MEVNNEEQKLESSKLKKTFQEKEQKAKYGRRQFERIDWGETPGEPMIADHTPRALQAKELHVKASGNNFSYEYGISMSLLRSGKYEDITALKL